jgi:RNA polymerase sigma-70 factor, ECF subfamily
VTDGSNEFLARRFEENRDRLTRVAFRMLGSRSEADDAVQEGWLRLSRADTSDVGNLGAWLTTVVARVCLDQLRSRDSRREDSLGDRESEIAPLHASSPDALHDAQVADSIGIALLVVLETLEPAERVAFVLHDMFDLSFAEIAPIVGRNPAAARQLASRARRRVRGASSAPSADLARRRAIVEAFLAASRGGDFGALLAMLDPSVVLRADAAAVKLGAQSEMVGADAVATRFSGHAKGAQLALVDGEPGAVWAPGGKPRVVFAFEIEDDRIVAIDLISGTELLAEMELEALER